MSKAVFTALASIGLGWMIGVAMVLNTYEPMIYEPMIKAKAECEVTLPRNVECVWMAPEEYQ